MKIVTRQELLNYPMGTIYRDYEPYVAGNLMVKDETYPAEGTYRGDWYEYEIGWASLGTLDCAEGLNESFDQDTICHRNGTFEERQFIVFEEKDYLGLIEVCKTAINNLQQLNQEI